MISELAKVHQALRQRGFEQQPSQSSDLLKYDGDLNCNGKNVSASILIYDNDFTRLPVIKLKQRPDKLPAISGHLLGPDNILCYGSSNINHIDPQLAHEQILACISSAEDTLNQLLTGDAVAETRGEFLYYWDGEPVLIDVDTTDVSQLKVWKAIFPKEQDKFRLLIANADSSPVDKFRKADIELESYAVPVHIFDCDIQPSASPENWPPQNLRDYLLWIRNLDKELEKQFQCSLLLIFDTQSQGGVFIFQNPYHWFGIFVDIKPTTLFGYGKNKRKKARSNWLHYLLGKRAERAPITRLSPIRIDDTYLVNRNLVNMSSLTGKNIALIGCGTIGGYLADLLVRSGAGIGKGKLILIDKQLLGGGNLGRHILGVADLYRNKAMALKEHLQSKIPSSNIESVMKDFRSFPLETVDLIIDATGEEPIHHYLNSKQLAGRFPDILYAWIVGAGRAVQTFLSDGSGGCYRCLYHAPDTLHPKFSPLKQPEDPVIMGQGCDDHYIPFSCAASSQVASLALQQTLDWVKGNASPRLRTRLMTNENTKNIPDCNPKKSKNCPSCNTEKIT